MTDHDIQKLVSAGFTAVKVEKTYRYEIQALKPGKNAWERIKSIGSGYAEAHAAYIQYLDEDISRIDVHGQREAFPSPTIPGNP